MNEIKVLVINGSVGAGKSSVAAIISEKFNKQGVLHAVIDMDYLRYAFPRPKDDPFHRNLGQKNLAAVAGNYLEADIKNFIIPNVIENQQDIEDINVAIPGSKVLVVRLNAKPETLQERLRARESGETLKWYLNRAAELSEQLERSNLEDMVIDTDNKSIEQLADEIVAEWT